MQVPETWHLFTIDGGGSDWYVIWINPNDATQWIAVTDGVEAGSWGRLDGVAGSIDPTVWLGVLCLADWIRSRR